jgi:hypothetical protein
VHRKHQSWRTSQIREETTKSSILEAHEILRYRKEVRRKHEPQSIRTAQIRETGQDISSGETETMRKAQIQEAVPKILQGKAET